MPRPCVSTHDAHPSCTSSFRKRWQQSRTCAPPAPEVDNCAGFEGVRSYLPVDARRKVGRLWSKCRPRVGRLLFRVLGSLAEGSVGDTGVFEPVGAALKVIASAWRTIRSIIAATTWFPKTRCRQRGRDALAERGLHLSQSTRSELRIRKQQHGVVDRVPELDSQARRQPRARSAGSDSVNEAPGGKLFPAAPSTSSSATSTGQLATSTPIRFALRLWSRCPATDQQ